MGRLVQVRYHRAILDSGRRVKYPAGAIIDSDLVPAGQEDRVVNYEVPAAVTKTTGTTATKVEVQESKSEAWTKPKDEDEEEVEED